MAPTAGAEWQRCSAPANSSSPSLSSRCRTCSCRRKSFLLRPPLRARPTDCSRSWGRSSPRWKAENMVKKWDNIINKCSDRSMEGKLPALLRNWKTNQPTDRPTNRRTDRRAHREVSLPIIMSVFNRYLRKSKLGPRLKIDMRHLFFFHYVASLRKKATILSCVFSWGISLIRLYIWDFIETANNWK